MPLPDYTSSATSATGGATSGATGANVRAAIARAAQASGVDFNYLLAQAKLESSFDPTAHAGTSSAAGLYQFTNATWVTTLQRHPDALGQSGGQGDGLAGGVAAALADPAARARLMALRYDPGVSAMMAAQLTSDNQAALTTALGHAPDATQLYMSHFLGVSGAIKLINADPSASAASLFPKAAGANRAIFYDASGMARSVGQVTDLLRAKVQAAMTSTAANAGAGAASSASGLDDSWAMAGFGAGFGASATAGMGAGMNTSATASPSAALSGGPIARQFAAAQAQDFAGDASAAGDGGAGLSASGSMADTLANTFDISGNGAPAPDYVRTAYARMQALGF